ncbi:10908_t:CDS:1, partial [Funneliformis caledonium]
LRNMDQTNLSYVCGLTTIKDESWEMDLSNLSEIGKYLLNIGILVPLTKKKLGVFTNQVSFTSNVIFRVVFQMV